MAELYENRYGSNGEADQRSLVPGGNGGCKTEKQTKRRSILVTKSTM